MGEEPAVVDVGETMGKLEEGEADVRDAGNSGEGQSAGGYYAEDAPWYKYPLKYDSVQRVWSRVGPALYRVYVIADAIGEKVADALGITQSRFQYAIDEHNRQMRKKRRKEQQIRKKILEERERERQRLGVKEDVEAGRANAGLPSVPDHELYMTVAVSTPVDPPSASPQEQEGPTIV
eukprot:Sspe_Gene.91130::Locus_62595_Transcript_1_1_Confidence_1.000_Length_641::g.91130::m.91130